MDWNAIYGALAPDPNKVYGQILPFARRQVQEPDWPGQPAYMQPYQGQPHNRPYGSVSADDYNFALPTSIRDGVKGVVDLARGTETGKLTPEALQAVTFGTLAPGMAFGARGSLGMGGSKLPLPRPEPSIRAYHGSPHSFDRFDMSKIGTGEGAQAYGHGLYFAEREGIARTYKESLSGDALELGGQRIVPAAGSPGDMALAQLRSVPPGSEPFFEARRSLRSLRDAPDSTAYTRDAANAALKQLDDWQLAGGKPVVDGHMYEVAIHADPAKFLDWDKPLTQQSPHVQKALKRFGFNPQKTELDAYDNALLAALDGTGPTKLPKQPSDPLGANIYESSKIVPGGFRDPVAASQALREAGIPGIKYLDQGSRAAGDGSRNHVVFDDNLIEILRKYGLGGPTPFSLAPPRDNAAVPNSMLPYEQRVY